MCFTQRCRIVLAAVILIVPACTTMKPEGATKAIVSGDVFSGSNVKDPGPVDYTVMEKRDAKAPVRWKVEF